MESKSSGYSERRNLQQATAHHYFIPASHQAYRILHFAFTFIPILAGVDKFFHFLVNWDLYLSPRITNITHIPAHSFMLAVGIVEILAGLLVAFKPRLGGMVVAAWLVGIILNLVSIPGYFDVAARDFGLALGAFALSRLSLEFEYYRRSH